MHSPDKKLGCNLQRNYRADSISFFCVSSLSQDGFLKVQGIADTGGRAKFLIQSGEVKVNGVTETRRGRKLLGGDLIELQNEKMEVQFTDDPSEA